MKSNLFPQFSDTDQGCGTISTFQCLCFFTTTRRVCLIPSLGVPSHSPAVRGSGKIPEILGPEKSRARLGPKAGGEGPGQGGVVRMGQDQDVVLEVGAVGWNMWRVERIKAPKHQDLVLLPLF